MALFPCNIGGGGTMAETVLWTNPSPTASMGSTNVSLSDNITKYKIIKFTFRHSTTLANEHSILVEINDFLNFGTADGQDCFSAVSRVGSVYARRVFYESDTSIAFASAIQINGTVTNNNACIPIKITGLS